MTTKHLLPTNASQLEKRAAVCLREAVQNPIFIADLINPKKCPVNLLPYLAWALSVDRWDENWSEEVKRLSIEQSFLIHKQKGTITAIKRVIEPIGYLIDLKEWFNVSGMQTGEFSLTVEVPEIGLKEETYNELVRLVDDAKPVSRHLKQLAIAISPTGKMNFFIGQYSADVITIYPQQ
ncbi:tail protein [Mannheimia granulomatis]|uniref:Tail protein n=1 Tax=Mannheimia granulomatis TaxID=85402 RepID=A0A011LWS7_9PAST|nr:phage tail protein I [Mannheimia granulomatis]EXI61668.1 tail protein [Mannheimia granulomatis]RGE48273.1 tail protein [Mannheimia granulomatis]